MINGVASLCRPVPGIPPRGVPTCCVLELLVIVKFQSNGYAFNHILPHSPTPLLYTCRQGGVIGSP